MWSLLLAGLALAADCPEGALDTAREAAEALEEAFKELDDPGFAAAEAELQGALPCVAEPLALRDVLALHRASALAAFVEGDMTASRKSWGAVRVLNPSWTPPDALAPPGHLLRDLFESAPTGAETVELELSPEGGWLVDGRRADAVPAERAFLLQAIDGEGLIIYTGYNRSMAEVPLLDFAKPGPSPKAKKMRLYGSLLGGALALGSGAAAWVHFDARSKLDEVDYDKFDATLLRGNVAGWSAIVLGAGAVGVTTAAWVVRW